MAKVSRKRESAVKQRMMALDEFAGSPVILGMVLAYVLKNNIDVAEGVMTFVERFYKPTKRTEK
jgi:uncharacterized protein (DUF2062 family)